MSEARQAPDNAVSVGQRLFARHADAQSGFDLDAVVQAFADA